MAVEKMSGQQLPFLYQGGTEKSVQCQGGKIRLIVLFISLALTH